MGDEGGPSRPRGEAELAAMVSSSDDAMVAIDLEGRVTSWNRGAQILLGYDTAEVVGRPALDLVAPSRRVELQLLVARLRRGERPPTRDTRAVHRDGREVEVALSLSVIRDGRGAPVGMSVVARDTTERKLAERELHRLVAETQRHERTQAAIAEVRLALLQGGDVDESLTLIARRARQLATARTVAVLLPAADGTLSVAACDGDDAARLAGVTVAAGDTLAGAAVETGRPQAATGPAPDGLLERTVGPQLSVPLLGDTATAGALSAVRSVGEPLFDSDEVRLLRAFAEQAALAIELARGRDDRQQLALAADRERIARDLHDHVIQRLFAVGMSLEAASGSISDAATLRRITSAVDQLDSTVREIRAAIFALEVQARRGESSVRARLADVAAQAASALGFAPRVYFEGPVDSRIPTEVAADVLAVVREALSNTARHAAATSVSVVVAAHDEVVVTVTDDGRGMRGATRTSGLANMRVRAEHRGGKLWVDSPRSGGTTVQWRVPLPV